MLQITNIKVETTINEKFSQESIKSLLENREMIVNYTGIKSLIQLLNNLISEFEEEVKIGTFNDINDYVEYYIERCREI